MLTVRSHWFALLIRLDWVRRSIRPPARGNHKYVDWIRNATELWIQHHGRLGQICTPDRTVHEWRVKHQVSHPVVAATIAKVLVFRHHVAHGSRLQRRQVFFLVRGFESIDDLRFRFPSQNHLRPLIRQRQDGSRGRRIKADRTSNFRVPKISGILAIEWAHPPSLHDAYPTLLAFDGSLIPLPSEDQNRCVAGYGLWGRAPSQGDLGIPIRHKVLLDRSHARVGILGILCLRWPARA